MLIQSLTSTSNKDPCDTAGAQLTALQPIYRMIKNKNIPKSQHHVINVF